MKQKGLFCRLVYETYLLENPSRGLCLTVLLGEHLSCKIVVNIGIETTERRNLCS